MQEVSLSVNRVLEEAMGSGQSVGGWGTDSQIQGRARRRLQEAELLFPGSRGRETTLRGFSSLSSFPNLGFPTVGFNSLLPPTHSLLPGEKVMMYTNWVAQDLAHPTNCPSATLHPFFLA